MQTLPRPRIALVFVAVMVALWIAHDPPDPTTSRALKDTAKRLGDYYREHPPRGGLTITEIAVRDGVVWVEAGLPQHTARQPLDVIATALGGLCPDRSDIAWHLLRPAQTIEVRGSAPGGKAIAATDCRAFTSANPRGGP